jgi:hippurate hydrolase
MATFIGTARRLAAMKDQWSGTLVMILQPGEETGEGAQAMLSDGLYTRFPKPMSRLPSMTRQRCPPGYWNHPGLCAGQRRQRRYPGEGRRRPWSLSANDQDPIVLASRIVTTLQTLVSRENDPANPAVVTVGSFQAGAKHNIISDEAKLQLTVRSYKPDVRKLLLDGIRRIARGEAIAAGMPEDKMPVVTLREEMYTPATFNTDKISANALALFQHHFGPERAIKTPAVMGVRISAASGWPINRSRA